MRYLVTGVNGLLGSNLAKYLHEQGQQVWGIGRQRNSEIPADKYIQADLLEAEAVAKAIDESRPDVIINCVGLADVDACEMNPAVAWDTNVTTCKILAAKAAPLNIRLLHISTDHLFAGDQPFRKETDTPMPLNEYARTKWAGEKAALDIYPHAAVIRTNFYGWAPAVHRPTFADWLFKKLSEQEPIKLFTNYFFNPIEVSYLAQALHEVAQSSFAGVLHVTGTERCSKFDFGRNMADIFNFKMDRVTACPVDPEAMPVRRPLDISLSVELFKSHFKSPLPNLRDGLQRLRDSRPSVSFKSTL